MALITRYVGNIGGADFANWLLAWNWLKTLGNLLNDYLFIQVADSTTVLQWWANGVFFNGHTVEFRCPFEDSHKGDPTAGFKTYINSLGFMSMRADGAGITIASQAIMDGLNIERTDPAGMNVIGGGAWFNARAMTCSFRNIIIIGLFNGAGFGIRPQSNNDHWNLSNIKIYNLGGGINAWFLGGTGIGKADTISIHDCGVGFGLDGNAPWNYKDCVGVNNGTDWDIGDPAKVLNNCADSDNSIALGNSTNFNCQANINPVNEFQSLDITNSNWLKLMPGIYTHPDIFTGGAPQLGRTGIVPGIAGNNKDIAGEDRPGADGYISIGAHELQYLGWPYVYPPANSWGGLSRTTDRFLMKPNWIQAGAVDFDYNRELIEFSGTELDIYRLSQDAPFSLSYKFTNLNREDEYYITNFFCEHRGKHKRFWIPLWKNMFTLTNDIANGDGIITIPNVGFHLVDRGYERIFIELKNGDQISRKVTAVLPDGLNENLILEGTMDRNISQDDIKYFSRLLLVRFNDDGLETKYLADSKSDMELTFYELTNEYELEVES